MKSAIGIGALLADGLGDTIRVSLTEDPELEHASGNRLAEIGAGRTEQDGEQGVATQKAVPAYEDPRDVFSFSRRAGELPVQKEEDEQRFPGLDYRGLLHRDGVGPLRGAPSPPPPALRPPATTPPSTPPPRGPRRTSPSRLSPLTPSPSPGDARRPRQPRRPLREAGMQDGRRPSLQRHLHHRHAPPALRPRRRRRHRAADDQAPAGRRHPHARPRGRARARASRGRRRASDARRGADGIPARLRRAPRDRPPRRRDVGAGGEAQVDRPRLHHARRPSRALADARVPPRLRAAQGAADRQRGHPPLAPPPSDTSELALQLIQALCAELLCDGDTSGDGVARAGGRAAQAGGAEGASTSR